MPTKKKEGKISAADKNVEDVKQARSNFRRWYEDPNTLERAGDVDVEAGVDRAVGTDVYSGFPERGRAEYDSGYTRGYREDGSFGAIDPSDEAYIPGKVITSDFSQGTLQHELTHAAQFDNQFGLELREVLGKDDRSSYRRNPGELYGNFHQLRVKLGLKPWERNMTPEKLMELVNFNDLQEDEEVKDYIEQYGAEKISTAINKIASSEADTRRLERLNFTPSDNVIMRPSNSYA